MYIDFTKILDQPINHDQSSQHQPVQETLGLGESASRPPPPKTLRALGTRPVGLRLSLPNGSDTVANSVMVQRFFGEDMEGWWTMEV